MTLYLSFSRFAITKIIWFRENSLQYSINKLFSSKYYVLLLLIFFFYKNLWDTWKVNIREHLRHTYLSGQCHHLALSRKNNKKQYFQVEFEFKSKIPKMFSTTDKIPSKNFWYSKVNKKFSENTSLINILR